MPDPPDLQAIRERAEKATEGPWYSCEGGVTAGEIRCGVGVTRIASFHQNGSLDYYGPMAVCNSHFAARARQDIPDLLAYVERIEADLARVALENERLKKEREEIEGFILAHADFGNFMGEVNRELVKRGKIMAEAVELLRTFQEELDSLAVNSFLSCLDQPQEPKL